MGEIVLAQAVIALAVVPRLVAGTPGSNSSDVIDMSAIAQGLNGDFWIVIALSLAFGAVGGLVYELINLRGSVEWPHRFDKDESSQPLPYAVARHVFDLGFIARMLVGAGAAIAVTLFIAPPSTLKLVATALLAGSAGTSVFGALQDRLLMQLTQKENAKLLALNSQARDLMQTALDEWPDELAQSQARRALEAAIKVSEAAERIS